MKNTLCLICVLILLSISSIAQTKLITVLEAVKVKNDNRDEALFYYENNWKVLRENAVKLGYIHSFELIESKADDKGDFDIVLITRYSERSQFEKSESRFQELIKETDGLKLLNNLKPREFRENVFVKIGTAESFDRARDQLVKNCDSAELNSFDFLVGNWDEKGSSGKMTITEVLGGCAIQEIWNLDGFDAIALRNYDAKTKKWYLTFTANDLIPQVWKGNYENGIWYFYRDWVLNGKPRRSRTYWKKTSANSFDRIVEQLNDDGKTWRLHVKAQYERESQRDRVSNTPVTIVSEGWNLRGDLTVPISNQKVPAVSGRS